MSGIIVLIIIFGCVLGVITFFIIKRVIAPQKVATLNELLKQGKYTAVTRMAKQIIAKEPRNAEAHFLLGQAYIADNKPEIALMEFKTVNQIGSFGGICKEPAFRKRIAELYAQFNQPEEALKEYLLLIKLEPTEADHYYHSGMLFEERNKSDKAVNFYRKTIEINPRHSGGHYKLGYVLYRGKKPVEAKVELENALKFDSENYMAHFYLGKILKENHDYVASLVSFEKAQRDPELKIKALVERGGCYMSMNNFDKAIVELERAIKLSKNESSTEVLFGRYFLAICHEKSRSIDLAIEQWEKIYAKKPSFRDVAEKLSQYQDLRADDKMKDYLTANLMDFQELCKSLTTVMNLRVTDINDIPNGCQIIAVDDDARWRNARKMPKLIFYLRVPEMIAESTVRNFHEKMKQIGVIRGVIITSSTFSRTAMDFAESRPIELLNKDKLQKMLESADINGQQNNENSVRSRS